MTYYTSDGTQASDYPTSEQQATGVGQLIYRDFERPCKRCEKIQPLRWVGHPDSCYKCLMDAFILSLQFKDANVLGTVIHPHPCKKGPHLFKTIDGGRKCIICEELKLEVKRKNAIAIGLVPPEHSPLPPEQYPGSGDRAIEAGREWFVPDFRCLECGTTAPRHTKDIERCQGCESTKVFIPPPMSSRQRAIAAGECWYVPEEPCMRCQTLAPRRVANGHCKGCEEVKASAPLSPRKAAMAAGERWYTPTDPCPRCGTLAERYVANGRCRGCDAIPLTQQAWLGKGDITMEIGGETVQIANPAEALSAAEIADREAAPAQNGLVGRYGSWSGSEQDLTATEIVERMRKSAPYAAPAVLLDTDREFMDAWPEMAPLSKEMAISMELGVYREAGTWRYVSTGDKV